MKLLSSEWQRTPLMISQYWFRHCYGAVRKQAIIQTYVDPDLCYHMASLGHDDLIKSREEKTISIHYVAMLETTRVIPRRTGNVSAENKCLGCEWVIATKKIMRCNYLYMFCIPYLMHVINNVPTDDPQTQVPNCIRITTHSVIFTLYSVYVPKSSGEQTIGFIIKIVAEISCVFAFKD